MKHRSKSEPPKKLVVKIRKDGTVECHEYHPYHDLFLGVIDELDEKVIDGIHWIMPYKGREYCG